MKRQQQRGVGASGNRLLFHQAIVKPHQLRVLVIFQDELPWPHLRLLPQEHFRSEVPLQLFQRGLDVRVHVNFRRGMIASRTAGGQPFDLPHRQAAPRGALGIAQA